MTDLEALGAQVGLAIDPAERDRVARQLARLLAAAALVLEFPLPEDVESAAVFRP